MFLQWNDNGCIHTLILRSSWPVQVTFHGFIFSVACAYSIFLFVLFFLKRERTWSCVHREVKEDLGEVGAGRSMIKIYSMNSFKKQKTYLPFTHLPIY